MPICRIASLTFAHYNHSRRRFPYGGNDPCWAGSFSLRFPGQRADLRRPVAICNQSGSLKAAMLIMEQRDSRSLRFAKLIFLCKVDRSKLPLQGYPVYISGHKSDLLSYFHSTTEGLSFTVCFSGNRSNNREFQFFIDARQDAVTASALIMKQ